MEHPVASLPKARVLVTEVRWHAEEDALELLTVAPVAIQLYLGGVIRLGLRAPRNAGPPPPPPPSLAGPFSSYHPAESEGWRQDDNKESGQSRRVRQRTSETSMETDPSEDTISVVPDSFRALASHEPARLVYGTLRFRQTARKSVPPPRPPLKIKKGHHVT